MIGLMPTSVCRLPYSSHRGTEAQDQSLNLRAKPWEELIP